MIATTPNTGAHQEALPGRVREQVVGEVAVRAVEELRRVGPLVGGQAGDELLDVLGLQPVLAGLLHRAGDRGRASCSLPWTARASCLRSDVECVVGVVARRRCRTRWS